MKASEALPTIAEPRDYEPAVDGLRGLAILLVMLLHQDAWQASPSVFTWAISREIIALGKLGVPIFFVLSGYLLYKTSRRRWPLDPRPVRSFYIRRFFRIVPLWWIAVTAGLLCLRMSWTSYAAYMTFYFGFMNQWAPDMPLPHAWSLFVEESFYLFFPLILPALFSAARVRIALIVSAVIALVWLQYGTYMNPLANYPYFFAGMAIFHARQHPRTQQWIERLTRRYAIYLLDLVLIALIATHIRHWHERPALIVLLIVFFGLIPKTGLHGLLNSRFFRLCGAYCYSLYLFHTYIYRFTYRAWDLVFHAVGIEDGGPREINVALSFAGDLVLSLFVAHFIFRWIEKPLNEFGRRLAGRRHRQ